MEEKGEKRKKDFYHDPVLSKISKAEGRKSLSPANKTCAKRHIFTFAFLLLTSAAPLPYLCAYSNQNPSE
jgi:hypothetical protein